MCLFGKRDIPPVGHDLPLSLDQLLRQRRPDGYLPRVGKHNSSPWHYDPWSCRMCSSETSGSGTQRIAGQAVMKLLTLLSEPRKAGVSPAGSGGCSVFGTNERVLDGLSRAPSIMNRSITTCLNRATGTREFRLLECGSRCGGWSCASRRSALCSPLLTFIVLPIRVSRRYASRPQHFLSFFPLPQGQGALGAERILTPDPCMACPLCLLSTVSLKRR